MTTPLLLADLMRDEGLSLTAEEWRYVVGYEGYEVSDHGRVRNIRTGKILKPSPRRSSKEGPITHFAVNLGRGNLKKIHQLVLIAFVGPRPVGLVGCHWNGDCSDNQASNLRWATMKENQADSVRHGTKARPPVQRRGSNSRTWLNDDDIRCIRAEPYFPGVNKMLGRCFGISYMTAYRVRVSA